MQVLTQVNNSSLLPWSYVYKAAVASQDASGNLEMLPLVANHESMVVQAPKSVVLTKLDKKAREEVVEVERAKSAAESAAKSVESAEEEGRHWVMETSGEKVVVMKKGLGGEERLMG